MTGRGWPGKVFLNCTKNTELTGDAFARTVSLGLIRNRRIVSAASRRKASFDNRRHEVADSGQRAMKSEEWKTYRTRFLVKAKQLSSSLSFVDSLGRQHSGRKGDYLVESSEGVVSIAPRQIFEDIYVAMAVEAGETAVRSNEIRRERRKLPQPFREKRICGPRIGLI